MFYGLAHLEEQFHVDNVYKVIDFAPCFVFYLDPEDRTPDLINDNLALFPDYGIFAFNGPNWDEDS